MKKLFTALFAVLGAMVSLTACEPKETLKAPEFTVTFNTDGGSEIKAVNVQEGKTLAKPSDPTKGDFIFVGWFKEATWVNAWDFDKDVVTEDITLYGKWTTITYTVTFNTNGGSAIAPATVAKGSKAIRPVPPTKTGAAFDDWYSDVALSVLYDFNTAVTGNLTIYAKWITVTRETLETLVSEAQMVSSKNYTSESYDAMRAKLTAAEALLFAGGGSAQQIAAAYSELSKAMSALVELPKRGVADIYISNLIDNIRYVNPGQFFNINASSVDATGEPATDSRVTFVYDVAKLESWAADGVIVIQTEGFYFDAKSTLPAGQTISLTIKSAENPAILKTITLKVAGEGEVKTIFINAVNALPAPDKISYEHYDAITAAYKIYSSIPSPDNNDPAVVAAREKLENCDDAYYNLPVRIKYSFKGDVCHFVGVDGDAEDVGDYIFVANGAFPAGVYTEQEWFNDGKYGFHQSRLTFNSDGTGISESRDAKDEAGKETAQWEKDQTFTYTNQGTQAAGGMFSMTFNREEEPPVVNPDPSVPESGSKAAAAKGSRSSSLRFFKHVR